MQVTKSIKIDLVEKGVQPIVYAKQNDRQTRFIAASLFANGQPFSVPDGVVAMFRAGKPDGTACFYDSNETGTPAITIEGNLVTVELAEQVLTAPGNVQAEINFYTAGGEKLTSFSFAIQVEKSVLTDQEIISSDYYNVLTEQVKAAQDAAQSAQTSAGQAEQALQEVEQMVNNASVTIQQAGQEQITAVQKAGAQQTAAAAAEADRAQGYAESINPAQFVKTVNGTGPDASGNVEVQAGVASVFGRTGAVIAQEGDYNAVQIEETDSRVFVSPQEKEKWNGIPGENLVINGGMQIWQRGESLTGVGGYNCTADRLIMHETAAGAFTVEKYNDPEMGLCAKITCTAAGWINLGTVVELVGVFPALTGSFYAKCSKSFENTTVISAISYDDGKKGQKDTISTSWQRVVFSLSNVTANGKLYFTCLRTGGVKAGDVFYLTGIKLEVGGQATPFVPRPYAEEMALCQRYYQTHELSLPPIKENTNAALYAMPRFNFPTPMRVAPTAKYVDRSGNSGLTYYSTQSKVPNISPSSFTGITDRVAKIVFTMPSGVTMALGDYVYTKLTLDAEIY